MNASEVAADETVQASRKSTKAEGGTWKETDHCECIIIYLEGKQCPLLTAGFKGEVEVSPGTVGTSWVGECAIINTFTETLTMC